MILEQMNITETSRVNIVESSLRLLIFYPHDVKEVYDGNKNSAQRPTLILYLWSQGREN